MQYAVTTGKSQFSLNTSDEVIINEYPNDPSAYLKQRA